MKQFRLINIEWNCWNGFIFELLSVDMNNFEGALLGLNFSRNFFVIDFMFFTFEIKSPFTKSE